VLETPNYQALGALNSVDIWRRKVLTYRLGCLDDVLDEFEVPLIPYVAGLGRRLGFNTKDLSLTDILNV